MGLNIKNAEVERLAAEVAALTGESKTEAIRRALVERKLRLSPADAAGKKLARMRRVLEEQVWPGVPDGSKGRPVTKEEREQILGYGEEGV